MYTGKAVNKLLGFVYSNLFAWCYLLQMSKYQVFWMSGFSQKKGQNWGLAESYFLQLLINCTNRDRVWCTLSSV